jgi:hypothetical protein
VLADVREEGRARGQHRHRIEQRQAAVAQALDEMAAQGGQAAEVVRRHRRPLQPPMRHQGGQQRVLNPGRDVLAVPHLRGAGPDHVEGVDREPAGQPRGDPPPRLGGPGKPVDQDQGIALAEPAPGDGVAVEIEALVEREHGGTSVKPVTM